MTNAELIKALRKCGKQSPDRCWDCEYYDREPWCESALANDAADAIERLMAEVEQWKMAWKTANKLYEEMKRNEQQKA